MTGRLRDPRAGTGGGPVDGPDDGPVGGPPGRDDYHARQVAFPGIGPSGQAALERSLVAVVGCGGTGSVAADLLVRAGVGVVRLIDRDYVEWSDLHRQPLYEESDAEAATPKALAASARLRSASSRVRLDPVVDDLRAANAERLLAGATVVVDGTDNFDARFLINDTCVKSGTPWVYGAAVGAVGALMPVRPGIGACLACLHPEPPAPGAAETCATAGVLNAVTSLVGSLAAAEAVKVIVGVEPLSGLLAIDLWEGVWRTFDVRRRPDCAVCVRGDYRHLDTRERPTTASLCGDTYHVRPRRPRALDIADLARRLAPIGRVDANAHLVRLRIADREVVVFGDGRAMVRGVGSDVEAWRLYVEIVGI